MRMSCSAPLRSYLPKACVQLSGRLHGTKTTRRLGRAPATDMTSRIDCCLPLAWRISSVPFSSVAACVWIQ